MSMFQALSITSHRRALAIAVRASVLPPYSNWTIANLGERPSAGGLGVPSARTHGPSRRWSVVRTPHCARRFQMKSRIRRVTGHIVTIARSNRHYAMGIWAAAAIAFPILGLLTEGLMMSAANIAKVLARRLAIMLAAIVLRAGVILLMVLGAAFLLLWSALRILHRLLTRDAAPATSLIRLDPPAPMIGSAGNGPSRVGTLGQPAKEPTLD